MKNEQETSHDSIDAVCNIVIKCLCSSGDATGQGSQSVVKQILIDEDEFFKVTGISFIILLIMLTIGFYYREDICEMKSKM